MVLPEASCGQCEALINRFEQPLLRSVFGPIRARYGFPSKRPKLRPKTVGVEFVVGENIVNEEVPVGHNPTLLVMRAFKPAGIFTGEDAVERPLAARKMHVHCADTEMGQEIVKRLGARGMQIGWPDNSDHQIALMVAKIAHSFAVAQLGINLDGFQALLPNTIRQVPGHLPVSYLVGCMGEPDPRAPRSSNEASHILRWFEYPLRDMYLLVVQVRLFESFNMPSYAAVVGSTSIENMKVMMMRERIKRLPTKSRQNKAARLQN
ncbi:hypothetical protein [uncultured Sphingosinicella sp.]|uniref:hypothetical protein n=1 Tax=uncultured Sphingosinicella sp. TaxID=478748 RepID=UPI0030D6D9A8